MNFYPASRSFRERWLAGKLGLPDLQPPFINSAQQQERIRKAILEQGVADHVAGRSVTRGTLTFAQCYADLYGAPLFTDELDFGAQPDSAA